MVAELTVTGPGRPTHPGLTPQTKPVYEEGVRLPDPRPRPQPPPRNWRDVPLPPAVAALPRDRRGYPVFVCVTPAGGVPEDGVVDFRLLNLDHHVRCARQSLCAICGRRLHRDYVFIGGPMCCQNRVFGDGPMHEQCARYALAVCPYLTNAHREYSQTPSEGSFHDPNVILEKPERLLLYCTGDYELHEAPGGKPVCIVAPARWVEWYTTAGVYLAKTRPTRYAQ